LAGLSSCETAKDSPHPSPQHRGRCPGLALFGTLAGRKSDPVSLDGGLTNHDPDQGGDTGAKRRKPTATSVEAIPAACELAALRAKIERGEAQLDALTRELTQPQPNSQAHAPAPVPDVDAPLARDR
jgi:hypothetical protein